MENSKFFQKIWRFNAIIIASAGLLAVIALLIGLSMLTWDLFKSRTREVRAHNIVNTSDTQEVKEILQYGDPNIVLGTDYIQLPLKSEQNYRLNSYKGKSTEATRNFVFFNPKTEETRWLLPNNDFLLQSEELYRTIPDKSGDEQRVVSAYLYVIIKRDSNGDKRLGYGDKKVLSASKPDGSDYRELLTDIDEIVRYQKRDSDTHYVFYHKADKAYLATIDVTTLSVSKNSELPKIPK